MRGDPDGREAAAASRPAGSVGSLPLRDAPSPARQEQQEPPEPRWATGAAGPTHGDPTARKGKTQDVRSALQGLLPHRREERDARRGLGAYHT